MFLKNVTKDIIDMIKCKGYYRVFSKGKAVEVIINDIKRKTIIGNMTHSKTYCSI